MWWLDPGKELLQAIFNRVMAPYLENLDMNQVNYGISSGSLTLRNLKLKREALDKFRLPVDVVEGSLGRLQLNIPWRNFNTPLQAEIDDLFLLVNPAASSKYDPEDDERRAQAAKQERLRTAETLQIQADTDMNEDSLKNQGFIDSIMAKIINNFQVTIKNIHIRYEDKASVPGHPFSAGITLAGFTILSVDGNWQKAFIPSTAGAIHKLAELKGFSIYFNTDSESIRGLPLAESAAKFRSLIATDENTVKKHQFLLKPVSGEGKITMNHNLDKETPKFDIVLDFTEISFILDDHQYRDVISMIDMYHFYLRHQQYRKLRPSDEVIKAGKAKAMLKFAGTAILEEVRERRHKWTWVYFAERRDQRRRYVVLYKKKLPEALKKDELAEFDALEKKLSYEDLRFYRSIARSELRKDIATRKKIEEEKLRAKKAEGGWMGWMGWGNSAHTEAEEILGVKMNEERKKELFEALDYDERAANAASFEPPKDSLKARLTAKLQKGSLTLKKRTTPEIVSEVMSVVFEDLRAKGIQRPTSFDAIVSLGDLHVHDGTTPGTIYPEIVKIKHEEIQKLASSNARGDDAEDENSLLMIKFEQKPLDNRADNALTARLKSMEVVYHKGYVEAIYKFLKPPETQMQSIAALMDVASETLEGFRNQTRASLEHALQAHKTIDVKMDLQSPIIIIPEKVTTKKGAILVIDAGHLAISSDLVPKSAIHEIYNKRKQQYTEEDYRQLESLMYDRFALSLSAAQFLLGNDLDSCFEALNSTDDHGLHLLRRTNIDFSVHNSIVPSALQLAKLKVAGKLPELGFNLSNTKYKALMRIIDMAIPKFGDEAKSKPSRPPAAPLGLALNAFSGSLRKEYVVDDNDSSSDGSHQDFYEAPEGEGPKLELRQHQVEFKFEVDRLQALLSKTDANGVDVPLAEVVLQGFTMDFAMARFDMHIDVTLRSLKSNFLEAGHEPIVFITSEQPGPEQDLVKIRYTRADRENPEFDTTYEGIDQSIGARISTIVVHAQPEPVVAMNDFIMSTFVPEKPAAKSDSTEVVLPTTPAPSNMEKIRVKVNLQGVEVILKNLGSNIAKLKLAKAEIGILLRGDALRVGGHLESLLVTDESGAQSLDSQLPQLLSIEGEDFADFTYETFNPLETDTFPGFNSSIMLRAASLKISYLEQPLHAMYEFLMKLARLKGLYDAAAQAAVQSVSEIQRLKYDIIVKTPIIVFPKDPSQSQDALILKLGEITAQNEYDGPKSQARANISGIGLTSHTYLKNEVFRLKIIDDVAVNANLLQTDNIDHAATPDLADMKISVTLSDIKLALTQRQYCDIMALTRSLARVVTVPPDDNQTVTQISVPEPARQGALNSTPESEPSVVVDLGPELSVTTTERLVYAKVDMDVKIDVVKLQLFDSKATSESDLRDCGIARFALSNSTVRYKQLSTGAGEAEIILKAFTITNTRPGTSKFREIIPAARHDRNQFMVLLTMSGGSENSSLAMVTIDSPKLLFTLDPVFALADFFTSAFANEVPESLDESTRAQSLTSAPPKPAATETQQSLGFRVDLHDASITILESDTDINTQAIRLSVQQVMMSQQGILALTITKLGMSLTQMGKSDETVRILDDVDMTLSLENKQTMAQQRTSIEITSQPIVFRVSPPDINLILAIVTRATQLASQPNPAQSPPPKSATKTRTTATNDRRIILEQPKLVMAKEKLKGTFDGFRLVLIGEGHEQPMLHFKTKPFIVTAQDWTGALHASMSMSFDANYWNLTNSHWEPIFDPWTVSLDVSKDMQTQALRLQVSSNDRLEFNITTTFIELLLSASSTWSVNDPRSSLRERGGTPPYKIRNETGSSVQIWSNSETVSGPSVVLQDGQSIDWRFDDWRSLREHLSVTGNNAIGIKFEGKSWDSIPSVTVDKEGQFPILLRPRIDGVLHRLLCDVVVENNVKIVTLRSTYRIVNECMYPVEVILVDEQNKPTYALRKIDAKQSFSLPIEAVARNRIKIRPDAGFGYGWSTESFQWEDFVKRPSRTVICRSQESGNAPYRLALWAEFDAENTKINYPKLTLQLFPPIELENLLPFDIRYRVHDKSTSTSSTEFLRKGGIFPIHTVQLDHSILLNISVQETGVWKPSHFMIINSSEFPRDTKLLLPDNKDRNLDLRLNYVRHSKGNSFKVQIYCPYIVINKTGLPFEFRSATRMSMNFKEAAGESNPDELKKPTPYMLSHPSERGHGFVLKVGESEWSEVLDFEAPTGETELVLPARALEAHIGLSWTVGSGKYNLIKVITLSPRYIIKNATNAILCYREHGGSSPEQSELYPNTKAPIHWMRRTPDNLLLLAYPGLNASWSQPINMDNTGSVHLRLQPNDSRSSPTLIRADVEITGATLFITLNRETKWPYRIENQSDYDLQFLQSDGEKGASDATPRYTVSTQTILDYAWDYPAAIKKSLLLTIGMSSRSVNITEIGSLPPFKFRMPDGRARAVSLDIRAEDTTQVLTITNYREELSVYKPARPPPGRQDTLMSQEAFEAIPLESAPTLTVLLLLEGLGISLMNRSIIETINLSIGRLQIDNQLPEATSMVVMQPTPLPQRHSGSNLPFIQCSVIILNDRTHGVTFVKYASILLQSITVRLDEDFLMEVIDLTKVKGAWEGLSEDILIREPANIPEPSKIAAAGPQVYFEGLVLQPIRLFVSFQRAERSTQARPSGRNPIAQVIHAFTMTIGSVDNVPLEFGALILADARMDQATMINKIIQHYRQGVISQVYKILGSIDFIGNPVGLFTNVSSGVADIFYEPYEGVIMHGSKELGTGIAKGAASFVKKTTFGLADTVTKVTSSFGKGLSSVTFDAEYQSRRRLAQRRNRPRHVFNGVSAGGAAFVDSVGSAVQGVVTQPMEGFERQGGVGFAKGVAKGVAGLFVKPVVGVTDLFTNMAEGVRNTTTIFDPPTKDRIRLPRHVPSDGVLRSYSPRDALGQTWMRDLEQGSFKKDLYVAHVEVSDSDLVLLLTTARILHFSSTRLRLYWALKFSEISSVRVEDTGITFLERTPTDYDKFVPMHEEDQKLWFYSQISKVVTAHNAAKRLESS